MQEYTVSIGGLDHTIQLTDEDAEARGLKPNSSTKEADAPQNKARTVATRKE
jgi:hypothetical protein